METPTAISAAPAMLKLKVSFSPTQMVRATPKNNTGGKTATRCAFETERRLSKSGTVKLVASKIRSVTTKTKRIPSETLRNAEGGTRAVSPPASAKMAEKLKTLAAKTAAACPVANRRNRARDGRDPTTAIGNRATEAPFAAMVRTPVSASKAHRFAKKIAPRESGKGTRLE